MGIHQDISKLRNPEKAKFMLRFFKTGPGEYGEGDIFLGLTVPQSRGIVRKYRDLPLSEVTALLKSKYHEERLIALLILNYQFQKGTPAVRKKIYQTYVKHKKFVNNWDLVDSSAEYIMGRYLFEQDRKILYKLVKSKSVWDRRIAVMTTFHFIRQGEFDETLKLAKLLLKDDHDLIHKAVGWMLREIGERDSKIEMAFLDKYSSEMPRTMLRYAIEKFPEKKRLFYLRK
ncbi:DNA alkylation repair protein [Bdellovibrio sp. HCB2-146]|uniref:DNA alkylation repair protein n=1 Tax=Bdellovibrio sp. HCB2-146 TaxID=3394362 RepID=UPI0039BD5813